ncbi:hypothetical protein [Desulfovibrio inopinatus]|uniref:hypothetical protein n=1 Tax=Desulfovibrio inopinatus TaxID=102109 RepID=UPI000427DD55|nr:hypothetical protein [Desulfovibrio inopinatus]
MKPLASLSNGPIEPVSGRFVETQRMISEYVMARNKQRNAEMQRIVNSDNIPDILFKETLKGSLVRTTS